MLGTRLRAFLWTGEEKAYCSFAMLTCLRFGNAFVVKQKQKKMVVWERVCWERVC